MTVDRDATAGNAQGSDIFISYDRSDRPRAAAFAEALGSKGYSVWWDRVIVPGQTWHKVLTQALESAGCVVVLWSKASVESGFVHDEAARGLRRGVLVPVLIESVDIPLGFGQIQTAHLQSWNGATEDPAFGDMLGAVAGIVGQRAPATRPQLVSMTQNSGELLIGVQNSTAGLLTDAAVESTLNAINIQLARDFRPHWRHAARLVLDRGDGAAFDADVRLHGDKKKTEWLSFHTVQNGRPEVQVAVKTIQYTSESWTVCLSHEVLEMLVDRDVNLTAFGPLPGSGKKKRVAFCYEICDPVASESYSIEGVEVSNFVLPSYFQADARAGSKHDFLGRKEDGRLLKPFGVKRGGYITYIDPRTGEWNNFWPATPRAKKR
jgi:hypothetical protein